MVSVVKKIGWVKQGQHRRAGQTLPTLSHRWKGRAGNNLCFEESNMVVGGQGEVAHDHLRECASLESVSRPRVLVPAVGRKGRGRSRAVKGSVHF